MDLDRCIIRDQEGQRTYRLLVNEDMDKFFKDFNMNIMYVTGRLLFIGVEKLDRYEVTEESFGVIDNVRDIGMIFRFDDGKVTLREIFSTGSLSFRE